MEVRALQSMTKSGHKFRLMHFVFFTIYMQILWFYIRTSCSWLCLWSFLLVMHGSKQNACQPGTPKKEENYSLMTPPPPPPLKVLWPQKPGGILPFPATGKCKTCSQQGRTRRAHDREVPDVLTARKNKMCSPHCLDGRCRKQGSCQ